VNSAERIGITAGASAPEVLVRDVVRRLVQWGATAPDEQRGYTEDVVFSLPRDLLRTIEKRERVR
jgi:4-hydroxy-3-methylbut-2-enyl diphosphate reductase